MLARVTRSTLAAAGPVTVASARLDAAATALVREWRLTLVALSCFVAVSAVMVGVAAIVRPLYVPAMLMILAGAGYNITRFVPRRTGGRSDEGGARVPMSPADASRAMSVLTARTPGWAPDEVHLCAHPDVRVEEDGTLVLGMPVLMCMDDADVAVLVQDALARRRALAASPVSAAVRVATGGLGRGLRDSGPRWASRRLLTRIDVRAGRFAAAYDAWVEAVRDEQGEESLTVHEAHDALREAWFVVLRRWILPAREEGYRQLAPFTGLRSFVIGAREAGLLPGRPGAATALGDRVAADYEERLVWDVLDAPEVLEPLEWRDHAEAVSLPRWRRATARALVALQRATGSPRPATVGAILDSLEQGWGDAAAAALVGPRLDGEATDEPVPGHVWHPHLAAAVSLAALELPGARLEWQWPFGPEVVTSLDAVLDVDGAVADGLDEIAATGRCPGLREWLGEQGIDVGLPLWLDEGAAPGPDHVLAAFAAYQRFTRNVMVVVSRRTIRVLEESYVDATRQHLHARMVGASEVLQPLMEAVEAGEDAPSSAEIEVRDVLHADLSPVLGLVYWRLALSTADRTHRFYGLGPGDDVERWLGAAVGDRLRSRSLRTPRWLRLAQATWGLGGVSLGLVVLLSCFVPHAPVLAMLALGGGLVVLALLPDTIALVWERLRSARRRREVAPLRQQLS